MSIIAESNRCGIFYRRFVRLCYKRKITRYGIVIEIPFRFAVVPTVKRYGVAVFLRYSRIGGFCYLVAVSDLNRIVIADYHVVLSCRIVELRNKS